MSFQPGPSSSMHHEDHESSRKRKAEPNPIPMKRPMNPFMLWCQKQRGEMLKTHQGLKPSEISRQLGEGWRNLTDQEKAPFYDEAERLKAEYEKHSTAPRKSASHVKRPMNPFMIWCRQKRGELLKCQPGMKPSDISKQLGEGWKSMSDEQKKPFVEEAERLKNEHEKNHPDYKFQPQKKEKRPKKSDTKKSHHAPPARSSYDMPLNMRFPILGSQQSGSSNAPGPNTSDASDNPFLFFQ